MVKGDFRKGVRTLKIQKLLLIAPNPKGGPGPYKPLFPPLGLMQVAALTPPDIEVEIIDEAVRPVDFDKQADLVGISIMMSAVRPRAIEIAQEFRRRRVPVVFGGVDPTLSIADCQPYADYIFAGEAEGGWLRFLNLLRRGQTPAVFRAVVPDLDFCPVPRRDLLNHRDYVFFNTVQTARGCSHDCSFCSVPQFSGHYLRCRPISHVVAEVKALPAGPVVFVDDNIVAKPRRASELFTGLMSLNRWWFAQADTTLSKQSALIKLAAESGCFVLFVGFESLSPASLAEANKAFNKIEEYRKLVKLLHHSGIGIISAMVFGFENDTPASFREAGLFWHRAKADGPQFSVLTPFPGTKFYEQVQGKVIRDDLESYDGTYAVFQPARMSAHTLEAGVRELYRWYYRSHWIVWRLISDPLFWRHPIRRLRPFLILLRHFAPRIWSWVRRLRRLT